jgi:hypothetical protein
MIQCRCLEAATMTNKVSVYSLDEKNAVLLTEHEYGIAKGYVSTSAQDMQSSINNYTVKNVHILQAALILCEAGEQKTKIKLLAAKIKN